MQARRFRFGEYEADFELQELRKSGTRVGLQHKPFHVLELLLSKAGQLVTRQELFDHLWPDSHVGFERGLNSAVNSLRQVLGESSRACHYIETRPGLGYRFIAPIQEVRDSAVRGRSYCTEPYQDCLKGRYLLNRLSEEDVYKALAFFHSASADETHGPLAHAGIADAYCQLALMGSVSSSRVCALARSAAERALEGNRCLAQALVSNARTKLLLDWDWKGARKAIDAALALDGSFAEAHIFLAYLLSALGDQGAGTHHCHQALEIDPLSFPANLQLAACHYAARDFQNAANQCWKILSIAANFAPAQLLLGLAYQQLGMLDEAAIELRNAALSPAYAVPALSGLIVLFAEREISGDLARTLHELSELGRSRHLSSYWHAVVCTARKEDDQALSYLEHSASQRDPAFLLLQTDPRFHRFRETHRFRILLNHFAVQ